MDGFELDDGTVLDALPKDAATAARMVRIVGTPDMHLRYYPHALPAGTTVIGNARLQGYGHPLPAGITRTGNLSLRLYDHPLPAGITEVGSLALEEYHHALPAGITRMGDLWLIDYQRALPSGTTRIGNVDLRHYGHPLPEGLTEIGNLGLDGYDHPLPSGITGIGGLYLGNHRHPLPMGIAGRTPVPVIPDIDRAVLAAVEANGLDMGDWHKACGTVHCIAGWHVHLAGEAGYALEARFGPEVAGALIYQASRPGMPRPDFHCETGTALAELRERAAT